MSSCCVIGCKNYYQKGFSMRLLPTNPTKRMLWISKINRKDWEESKKWFICEVHFSEDMWEKPCVDGKRKLKQNAVPTIFNRLQIEGNINEAPVPSTFDTTLKNIQNKAHYQIETGIQEDFDNVETFQTYHEIQHNKSNNPEQSITLPLENILEQCTERVTQLTTQGTPQSSVIPWEETLQTIIKNLEEAESNARQTIVKAEKANQKLQRANMVLCRMNKSRRLLQKYVKKLNDEKKMIVKQNLRLKSLLKLNNIFNEDQIQVLAGKNPCSCKWSGSTIMKALQLKFSCGSNGYNELLKQRVPLPSERTLRRKKEHINFQEGILYEVFAILQKQVSHFKDDREKDAAMAVDEISIVSGEQFDPSTHSRIGYASIPDNYGKELSTQIAQRVEKEFSLMSPIMNSSSDTKKFLL